jgi:thiamine kinase-like enzyme
MTFDGSVPEARRDEIAALLRAFGLAEHRDGCTIAVLAGGASNANYLVTAADGERSVLRVASQGVERFGIDRARGLDAHRSVAAIGHAPELLAADPATGHSVARFIDGTVLDAETIRAPGVLDRVASTLRHIHDTAATVAGRFSIFRDQAAYTRLARAEGLDLPADIDELNGFADRGEAVFEAIGAPERLCHNDLQIPNFIDDGTSIQVLDWEFAGTGNPYFDLGSVTVNAELDGPERTRFLRAYFGDDDPRHGARLELMLFMSALREATWAVIAEPVLDLDWDYRAWAATYYDRARRPVRSGALASALVVAR